MKFRVLLASISIVFYCESIFSQSGSTSSLAKKCGKAGYSCGECETNLQDDFNKLLSSLLEEELPNASHWSDLDRDNKSNLKLKSNVKQEEVLQSIIDLLKKHNPEGKNRLNFVAIGESESLQATSIVDGKINPRIMLKSPSSEIIVTFNTDKNAAGYNTIEIMRWNGKNGRYEFQELDFTSGSQHADLSGAKCLACHKEPSPRPNWDTYRAWAGVFPSRDDMLETNVSEGKNYNSALGMQPDAKAYMNVLNQIAHAKESPQGDARLKLLDIPFDTDLQLKGYIKKDHQYTAKEQISLINKHIKEKGYYRIKHFPDLSEVSQENALINLSTKTAKYAGPSQFAFDQMLAQNMCRVATDLTQNPSFEIFKYALTGIAKCGVSGFKRLSAFFPPDYAERLKKYHLERGRLVIGKENLDKISAENVYDLIFKDTK